VAQGKEQVTGYHSRPAQIKSIDAYFSLLIRKSSMLIQSFFAPQSEVDDVALNQIQLERLGQFVLLAGANGSGKSRLLNKLEWFVNAYENSRRNVSNVEQSLAANENALNTATADSPEIDRYRENIKSLKGQFDLIHNRVKIRDGLQQTIRVVRFVPKQLTLSDPHQHPTALLLQQHASMRSINVDGLHGSCLGYIQQTQNRWREATYPDYSGSAEEKQEAIVQYKSLNDLLLQLLKVKLSRDVDGRATLFGKPIAQSSLSDGQKIILQFCTLVHAQGATLSKTVFLLDEPENHLHPSAVIELLESVRKSAGDCQFWIATHSVPLIAYIASIEPMSVWYMDDGKASNAGRSPEKVLRGLLGDDERIAHLREFTGLPAQLAETNFAAQSLLPPAVVEGGESDPQVEQISKLLRDKFTARAIVVLDYGAGKGRLLDGMASFSAENSRKIADWVNYYAYDEFDSDQALCKSVIKSSYPYSNIKRYFANADDFHSNKDDGSIDVVVMCNVLHEISPKNWTTELFGARSLIMRALSDLGYLLIVEDQRIPVGEKAHEHGFLVLDTLHLKTLFSITEQDIEGKLFLVDDARGDERLKAHLIAKCLLSRITDITRRKAIEELKSTAKVQIKKLRVQTPNYKTGQLHGFWLQQLANAQLYLDEVGGNN
jgi:predicted ATPase